MNCSAESRLKGCDISLSFPSVGATENIMLAAATAQGTTVISNAAQEPEIIDLADFLNKCGAKIQDAGKSTIIIEGVEQLSGAEHTVIPDRIVATTYLCCAAATGGEIILTQADPEAISSVLPVMREMGCKILTSDHSIYLKGKPRLKGAKTIRTLPYPGFPTDAQALLMALAARADGTTVFVENIFENRFKHAGELCRMGADIKIEGKVAVVQGVKQLYGASVRATDLRGGAAMIIAGLAAQGDTTIEDVYHIERGYENICENLGKLGANIEGLY